MFKTTANKPLIAVAVLLIIVSCGLAYKQHNTEDRLSRTEVSVQKLKSELDASNRELRGDIAEVFSAERVVTDPLKEKVYIPEFRLVLPLNQTTKTIAYKLRTDFKGNPLNKDQLEADITSTIYAKPDKQTVVDCSELLRIKLEPKAMPYSPHEKPTSLTLSDGRSLQIYESINEKECAQTWDYSMSPETLAEAFIQAEAY